MNPVAIRVEKLSKVYRLGVARKRHDTLRDQLVHRVGTLFGRNGHCQSPTGMFQALTEVSFEVNRGEVIGIIGRNGAGKSTLLKILSRITEPTSGRARIYGRVGSLLEVGTGFHGELSGRENIHLSGALLGMRRAEIDRKFDAIVDFSGVEQFLDTPVKRYSSGMYVRLAFAVAAHLETEVLLVDEVLAVGDAEFQKRCLGKMNEVARQGRTVLFVSHNMPMIEHLCQRGILLRDGAVAANGETREVISAYLNELSGLSAMDLSGRTDRSGTGEVIATKIELLNEEGTVVEHAATGQSLVIRIHYRCQPGRLLQNCKATLIVGRNEQVYFVLSSWMVDNEPLDLEGEGWLDLIVSELPLTSGTYRLDSFLESNEPHDIVAHAAELSVVDGDFFSSGKVRPSPHWQNVGVLVRHSCRQGTSRAARRGVITSEAIRR